MQLNKSWPPVFFLILRCLWGLGGLIWLSGDCWAKDAVVAIDIGHTPERPGAISARGRAEYLFNKTIAALVYTMLRGDQRFEKSFIINETGSDISLAGRAALANSRAANLLVSIHHDSVEPKDLSLWCFQGKIMPYCDKFTGHSIFYSEKNACPNDSLTFAIILGTEMSNAGFCPTLHHAEKFTGGDKDLIDRSRGIYKYNNLIVLKKAAMPAVLFECGIIKNREAEVQLRNPAYQKKIAAALFRAVRKYFQLDNP